MSERHEGKHFQIEYSVATKKYTMRDLGKGFGVFVRIDYPQARLTYNTSIDDKGQQPAEHGRVVSDR